MRKPYVYEPTSLLLSKSNIGSINKCRCCDLYHLSIANMTIRLAYRDILHLAEMLIEALELDAIYGLDKGDLNRKDA
jgi:hypothetical protein